MNALTEPAYLPGSSPKAMLKYSIFSDQVLNSWLYRNQAMRLRAS
jgi:hypothetical protein